MQANNSSLSPTLASRNTHYEISAGASGPNNTTSNADRVPRTVPQAVIERREVRARASSSPNDFIRQILQTPCGTITIHWNEKSLTIDGPVIEPSLVKYRKAISRHERPEFAPGVLIRARHFDEACELNGHPTPVDERFFFDVPSGPAQGTKVCFKERLMIVYRCYVKHYTALPLYTHGGRGLGNDTEAYLDEHMSIRDRRKDSAKCQAQNKLPVLDLEKLDEKYNGLDPLSTVHFTRPVSRYYDQHCVIEGYLTKPSMLLLRLCGLLQENHVPIPLPLRRNTR